MKRRSLLFRAGLFEELAEMVVPGVAHDLFGEVVLVDVEAVGGEVLEAGGIGGESFEVGEDLLEVVAGQDPADFVLVDVVGDGGVRAAGEEDGAADGEGSEEFGGDDGAGPIRVEADEVDVGG